MINATFKLQQIDRINDFYYLYDFTKNWSIVTDF